MSTENQENSKQGQNNQLDKLRNSTDESIISILIELKELGNLNYLETLLEIVLEDRSETLKKALVEFVSDIKLQSAVPIISKFVSENIGKKGLTKLITASWQSRLDFSKYLDPYFQVLVKGDYKIAFEAFTVIENSLEGLDIKELEHFLSVVKKGIPKADRDKQLLLLEMVSTIEKFKRAAS
jgi:hypothetical protein